MASHGSYVLASPAGTSVCYLCTYVRTYVRTYVCAYVPGPESIARGSPWLTVTPRDLPLLPVSLRAGKCIVRHQIRPPWLPVPPRAGRVRYVRTYVRSRSLIRRPWLPVAPRGCLLPPRGYPRLPVAYVRMYVSPRRAPRLPVRSVRKCMSVRTHPRPQFRSTCLPVPPWLPVAHEAGPNTLGGKSIGSVSIVLQTSIGSRHPVFRVVLPPGGNSA